MMSLDVLRACAVLQDCADRLSVLGNIMRPGADGHQRTELHLKTAQLMAVSGLSDLTGEINTFQKQYSIRESLLAPDNLAKVQKDRQFVSGVINGLMVELQKKNTFESLFSAVEEEHKKKAQLLDIMNREEESRLRIKALQKQFLDIHKQKTECESLEELVAHLKHQIQELRVRTDCQGKFVKNCAEQLVCQGLQLNSHKENELENEIRMLQERIEEESNVHLETETFLTNQHTNLKEKFQFWMHRYEKDLEKKDEEISGLQNKRNNCLTRLSELSKKCRDMQEVIIEDRMEKERLRAQLEKEQMERDAATKIQAWWRGTLVRKGPSFSKKADKSKSKAGKKGKKKKK